ETKAPEGYDIGTVEPEEVTLAADNLTAVVYAKNPKILGSLTIQKVEAGTDTGHTGPKFTVTGPNHYERTDLITNDDGVIELTGLETGEYTVTEVEAPAGYEQASPVEQTVTIDGDHRSVTVTFENPKKLGSITILKVDENGEPLAGAQFTLKSGEQTWGPVTTGDDGKAVFPNLDWGRIYQVVEAKAPQGYELGDLPEPLELKADDLEITVEVTNTRKTGTIRIVKTDESGQNRLKDAEFKVTSSDGRDWGTKKTDENGEAVFDNLEWGLTYTVAEVTPPAGYEFGAIEPTDTVEMTAEQLTFTVTAKNPKKTGTITVIKTDESGNVR